MLHGSAAPVSPKNPAENREGGGGSAFSVITPKLWYDLPAHVRMAIFKTRPNLNVVVDDFSAVFWHFVQHFVRLCCKGCSINKIGLD